MKTPSNLHQRILLAVALLMSISFAHGQDTVFLFSGSLWSAGSRSYAPMSATYDDRGKSIRIYTSFGSKQSGTNKGLWIGSNAAQKAKLRLDFDLDRQAENLALARALGIKGSDTAYAALVFEEKLYEISEVSYTPTALSGASADSILCCLLYSIDEGISYQSLGWQGPQNACEALVWRFFPPLKEARFAWVFYARKDFVSRSPNIVFLRNTLPMVWVEDLFSQKLTSVHVPNTRVGDTSTLDLQLVFEKLQNDLLVTVPEGFSVYPQRLSVADTSPQKLSLRFFPSQIERYSGYLRLSEGGLLQALSLPLQARGTDSNSPLLRVLPPLLGDFCAAPFLEKDSLALRLQGQHLVGDLRLALTGTDSAFFRLSASSSLAPQQGRLDTLLQLIYAPTTEGQHQAFLEISGGGAETQCIALRASAKSPQLDSVENLPATNIGALQFIAQWKSVAKAPEYLLYVEGENCSQNLVANGGFEEGKRAWTGTSAGSILADSSRAYSGKGLASHVAENCRFEQLVQGLLVGKEYRLSFVYSGLDNDRGLRNFSIHGSSGTRYLDPETMRNGLEKSLPWRRYELDFVAQETTIKISLRTTEACLLDDVVLHQCRAIQVKNAPFTISVDETTMAGSPLALLVDSLLPNSEYRYAVVAKAPHHHPSALTSPTTLRTAASLPTVPSDALRCSPLPGVYSQSQRVRIELLPPYRGTIRYSLDSTWPGPHSPSLGDGDSLLIQHSCKILYAVDLEGFEPFIDSATYCIERCKAPRVLVDPSPATRYSPFALSLEVPQAGLEIRYTLDSSLPHRHSTLYTAPILVDRSLYLQALAFGEELDSSPDSLAGGYYTCLPLAKASLPLFFQGGKEALKPDAGWHAQNLGDDYGKGPRLRFDNASDIPSSLTLHCDTLAAQLAYEIKWYKGSQPAFGGEFRLETSVDGIHFVPLKTYNDKNPPPSSARCDSLSLPPATNYLRWSYPKKINGNIALGNIHLQATSVYCLHLLSPTKDSIYKNAHIPVEWELSPFPKGDPTPKIDLSPKGDLPSKTDLTPELFRIILTADEQAWSDTLFSRENKSLLSSLFAHQQILAGAYRLEVMRYTPDDGSNSLSSASITFSIRWPECSKPSELRVSDLEPYSARLSWKSNNEHFLLSINAEAAFPVEGNDYLLSPLKSATTYSWSIRALCPSSDSSDWAQGVFSTPHSTASTQSYTPDFVLYPNPAKNDLFLRCTHLCRIEIFALGGQKMAQYPPCHALHLSLAAFPRGAYVVCFVRKDGRRHSELLLVK